MISGLTHSILDSEEGSDVPSPLDIVNQISRYLNNEIQVGELEDWVVRNLPGLLKYPGSTAFDLAGTVELGLAELSIGEISEADFKSMLKGAAARSVIRISEDGSALVTSSSNKRTAIGGRIVGIGSSEGPPVRYERIQLGTVSS
jgi:hypothetical protein